MHEGQTNVPTRGQADVGHFLWIFTPSDIFPPYISPARTIAHPFTWCRTFAPYHHRHAPILYKAIYRN